MDRVIGDLVLEYGPAKVKLTPDEANPLIKDEDGLQVSGQFSYSCVVWVLL